MQLIDSKQKPQIVYNSTWLDLNIILKLLNYILIIIKLLNEY